MPIVGKLINGLMTVCKRGRQSPGCAALQDHVPIVGRQLIEEKIISSLDTNLTVGTESALIRYRFTVSV
jgi:hypothetical protein